MIITFFIFILGLAIGSFLNVLIDRIPLEEPVVKDRSRCDSCRHTLAWFDLVPLFSWLSLKGKCRYCQAKIPAQNPIVELTTGLIFVVTYYLNPDLISVLFYWFIWSALLVIFVVDLKHYIIPDKVLFPALLVVFIYKIIAAAFSVSLILSALGAAFFFLTLLVLTRGKGMGMGDVKYGLLMGLFLGYPLIVVGLYIAFLTGSLISVILLLLGKKKFGQHIPFGPFLVLGTVTAFFWGNNLWQFFWGYR